MNQFRGKIIAALLCVFVFFAFLPVATCMADTLEDLKKQIEMLQQKVKALEEQQQAAKAAQPAAQAPAAPPAQVKNKGSFLIPGTETYISIGGYAKVDVVYSSVSAGDNSAGDQLFIPSLIPVGSQRDGESDQLVIHARQSRFFIKTKTPTDFGKLKTRFEGDFFGSGGNQVVSNSYGFRLRHAFGQLGGLLAGQTWSTFMDVGTLADTLDFGGPAASIFIRQAQLRWTQPFDWGNLQFAVENPESTFTSQAAINTSPDDDRFPDIVARVNLNMDFGHLSFSTILRQFRIDDGIYDDDTWGGAVALAGRIPTFGKDDLRFLMAYGNIGRYMTTGFADAAINPNTGDIETYAQWGGYIAYRHFWLDNLRSTLVYSYGEADNDTNYVSSTVNKMFQSVHANLIWSPVKQMDIGIEYLWGYRELENDENDDLNRGQFSVTYKFF